MIPTLLTAISENSEETSLDEPSEETSVEISSEDTGELVKISDEVFKTLTDVLSYLGFEPFPW